MRCTQKMLVKLIIWYNDHVLIKRMGVTDHGQVLRTQWQHSTVHSEVCLHFRFLNPLTNYRILTNTTLLRFRKERNYKI